VFEKMNDINAQQIHIYPTPTSTHSKPKKKKQPPKQNKQKTSKKSKSEQKSEPNSRISISTLNLKHRRTLWYILIRHACDDADHTDIKHAHDAPLCNNPKHNKDDIQQLVKTLCLISGEEPDQIYTSPLERCVLTAKRMKKSLETNPEIIIEPNMSRHFTYSEQEKPDISKKSIKRGTPITESKKEFERRIEKHLNKIEKSKIRVIWCVTHALVMKRVDVLNQEEKPFDHIKPLQYRVFERKGVIRK